MCPLALWFGQGRARERHMLLLSPQLSLLLLLFLLLCAAQLLSFAVQLLLLFVRCVCVLLRVSPRTVLRLQCAFLASPCLRHVGRSVYLLCPRRQVHRCRRRRCKLRSLLELRTLAAELRLCGNALVLLARM